MDVATVELDMQVNFLALVGHWMARKQVSPVVLAHRLGWTQSRVAELLDGEKEPTVKDMADIAWALDLRLGIDWRPL